MEGVSVDTQVRRVTSSVVLRFRVRSCGLKVSGRSCGLVCFVVHSYKSEPRNTLATHERPLKRRWTSLLRGFIVNGELGTTSPHEQTRSRAPGAAASRRSLVAQHNNHANKHNRFEDQPSSPYHFHVLSTKTYADEAVSRRHV
jgi:hypothetical protein